MGRRRTPDGFRVEEWNGHVLMVNGQGVFYTTNDDGHLVYEAKTLDGLKAKINQQTKVDILALMERGYSSDDRMKKIKVYAFTGIGNILFTEMGSTAKEKASRWDKVYVFDEERLKKRQHFRAQQKLATRNLEKLMEEWPRVRPPNDQGIKAAEALQDWGAGKHLEELHHPEPESEQ